MATAILTSLLSMINNLSSNAIDEQLYKLKISIQRLQTFVHDAEKAMRDDRIKHWLQELKDIAYDFEDMLEEFEFEFEVQARSEVCSSTSMLSLQDGIVSKVNDITKKLDELESQCQTLDLKQEFEVREFVAPVNKQEPIVYGREDDKKKLVELILDNQRSDLCVIPIVGAGGVGKTTVARIVYNDCSLREHFDAKGWVCVSEDFDMVRLMLAILVSISETRCCYSELEHLKNVLREELGGRRFLLVLDDVCNEDERLWESLKVSLMAGLEGSTVIVTTRNETVASIVATIPLYCLDCLTEDDSWSLFQMCAFDDVDSSIYPNLVSIGKQIVKKVRGLPLAAKMLGESLRNETDEQKWHRILQSGLWLDQSEVWPALVLSYCCLPAQLKQCFTYCSMFPKDNLFKKDRLIRLWMAEGFIKPIEGQRIDDIGNQYFDELLRRSFFEHSETDRQSFMMHNLVHDLAKIVSEREICRMYDGNMCSISSKARHAAFVHQDSSSSIHIQSSDEHRALRTLLIIHRLLHSCSVSFLLSKSRLHLRCDNNLFINLQCLRALDLSETDIIKLPDSFGRLIHLRFIGLNHTKIESLPESICNLYKLQTLEMLDCGYFRELPKAIKNLKNLRHLLICSYVWGVPIPPGIGALTSLQTLTTFHVGSDQKEQCVIKELKDLVNLRGKLCISGIENVASVEDAKDALKEKADIKKLILRSGVITTRTNEPLDLSLFDEVTEESCQITQPCSDDDFLLFATEQKPNPEEERIFNNLKPHTNLKELVIQNYYAAAFPQWIGDPSFSNLVSINLDSCSYCKVLPPLGQLQSLRYLRIESFSELECISTEFIRLDIMNATNIKGFPALETLYFGSMYKLEEWSNIDATAFPQLRLLNLNYCPKLKSISRVLASLRKLVLWVCSELTAIPELPSLTSLELDGRWNEKLWSSIPENLLARLLALKIYGYNDLSSFPLHQLCAIKELDISGTGTCSSLGLVLCKFECLERLKIHTCPGICFLPDQEVPRKLKLLEIFHCPLLEEWCQGVGRSKLVHVGRIILDRKVFHPTDVC